MGCLGWFGLDCWFGWFGWLCIAGLGGCLGSVVGSRCFSGVGICGLGGFVCLVLRFPMVGLVVDCGFVGVGCVA